MKTKNRSFTICSHCNQVLILSDGFVCTNYWQRDVDCTKVKIYPFSATAIDIPDDCELTMEHKIINQPELERENT